MTSIERENKTTLRDSVTIRRLVCEHYKITVSELMKRGRATQHVARAKQVTCYLLFRILGVTQWYASEMTGATCHGSSREGAKTATDQMSVYPTFKTEVEMLEAKCREEIK